MYVSFFIVHNKIEIIRNLLLRILIIVTIYIKQIILFIFKASRWLCLKFKNNSIIVNEMFEDISIIDNGKVVSIHLKPVSNFKYFEESSMYSSLLDKVNFEINIPYKVIDGNYDKEENGVYTWTINKGENLKGINIS